MDWTAPEPLAPHHDLDLFDSGTPALDDWLKRRARPNQVAGASRTYILAQASRVAGYYALASGAVASRGVPGRFRRNMPDPIPVAILARLAIDRAHQGKGLGRALVRDAGLRVAQAADLIGIRGLVVHALSNEAHAFYTALGFLPSQTEPMMLVASLHDIRAAAFG